MHKLIQRGIAALGTVAMLVTPFAGSAAVTTSFNVGDLIKGSGDTVYYFGPDGHRYVFPNSKTYFTWYVDFSTVKQIPDGHLSTIPLGRSNVTYRPGKKMIKITTDPRVYVVDQGGLIRHVATAQLAETLYGLNWKNQIEDVPDAFFVNYRRGTQIQTASDYNPSNVMTLTTTISQDKQFSEGLVTVTIGSATNGYVPTTVTIKAGTEVTFTNSDITAHTVTGNGWGSGNIQPGQTYVHKFSTVGSFDYHCALHPVMQATVNVVP